MCMYECNQYLLTRNMQLHIQSHPNSQLSLKQMMPFKIPQTQTLQWAQLEAHRHTYVLACVCVSALHLCSWCDHSMSTMATKSNDNNKNHTVPDLRSNLSNDELICSVLIPRVDAYFLLQRTVVKVRPTQLEKTPEANFYGNALLKYFKI